MTLSELDFDLNQDLQRALEHQNPGPPALVPELFAPRACRPRTYERRYGLTRRVQTAMVAAGDEFPLRPPRGWDLLVLLGYAFRQGELERLCRILEEVSEPAVLVGLPRTPLGIAEELREYVALGTLNQDPRYGNGSQGARALKEHRDFLLRRIREHIRAATRPRAFRWRYQGAPLEWSPPEHRRDFLAQALETVYSDTPRARPRASRRAHRLALEEMLDVKRPLFTCRSSSPGADSSRLIQSTLTRPGLFVEAEDLGSLRRLEVQEWPGEGAVEQRLWRDLLEQVYGDREGERRQTLDQLLNWLEEPPRGLRGPMAHLYVAASLRARAQDLEWTYRDRPVPVSPESFRQALTAPRQWELRYRIAERTHEAFLKSVRGLFGTGSMAQMLEGDLWDRTYRQMRTWYEQLPALTRASRATFSQEAQDLLALFEIPTSRLSLREFLSRDLPAVLGLRSIPPVDELSIFLGRIDSLLQELEDHIGAYRDHLAAQIVRAFNGQQRPTQWLEQGARQWLEGLHPGTLTRPTSPWAHALRRTILSDGPVEQRWFVELPQALGMPPINDWERDQSRTFLARMMQARAELELWKVQEVIAPGQDPVRLKEQVRDWIHLAMDLNKLSVPEREAVLLDLLDELVW